MIGGIDGIDEIDVTVMLSVTNPGRPRGGGGSFASLHQAGDPLRVPTLGGSGAYTTTRNDRSGDPSKPPPSSAPKYLTARTSMVSDTGGLLPFEHFG